MTTKALKEYVIETIPKDSKGHILVDEYREKTWHTQQMMLKEMIRINGTVARHENRLKDVEKTIDRAKWSMALISGVGAIIGFILGTIAKIKQLI